MDKIFVIAGNYEQFHKFKSKLVQNMTENNIDFSSTSIVYVNAEKALIGIKNPWGYRVGTWGDRTDLPQIEERLAICGSSLTEDFLEV